MNKETTNLDQRVLGRVGARELTSREIHLVTGGFLTNTIQTFNPITKMSDGDHTFGGA